MARIDVRTDDGNWIVVSQDETLKGFERYRDAELKARQIAQSLGGGEVFVHARGGQIIEKQVVQRLAQHP
jgi:hypothetical protein